MTTDEKIAEIDRAFDKFTYDLGFTAPELFPMRIDWLRRRMHAIVSGEESE